MPDLNATAAPVPLVILVHAAATWSMVGLIWFVQVVHYPLMRRVPRESSTAYAKEHQARTTRVVAPLMLIEAASALWLVLGPGHDRPDLRSAWWGVGLLAIAWGCTFLVMVPMHATLSREHSASVVDRLIALNWIRTAAWTARGVLVLDLVHRSSAL